MVTRQPESRVPTVGADAILRERGLVEIVSSPAVAIDMRYATDGNFLGRPLYGGHNRLWLHPIAAAKLRTAGALLPAYAPRHRLLVFDGLRPNSVQRLMWDAVRGTPQQRYVGDPAIGSIHGFGLAVDVSLLDPAGLECDMGTDFDDFSPKSESIREGELLREGTLTLQQVANRHRLRRLMLAAGFFSIPIEWWHFDALPADEVRQRFQLVE